MTADKMEKKKYFFLMKLIKNYYLFLNKVIFIVFMSFQMKK